MSKICEKIVAWHLRRFITEFDVLSPCQSGFRQNHSTTTALLKICNELRKAMDDRQVTVWVSLDFSKAFDSVNHAMLLQKLEAIGVGGQLLTWMGSYVRNRAQRTYSGVEYSSWRRSFSGVPQGSLLGPLLFVLYINDIVHCVKHCSIHMYADDVVLWLSGPPEGICSLMRKTNEDLHSISRWAAANSLMLNPEKCKWLLVGTPKTIKKVPEDMLGALEVDGCRISRFSHMTVLGVVFDSHLSWKEQANSVVKRINSCLHPLMRWKRILSFAAKKIIVSSLVMPLVWYGDVVFYDIPVTEDMRIQRALNRAVKFIFNAKREAHVSPLLRELGWLTAINYRKVNLLCMARRILDSGSPGYLRDYFIELRSERREGVFQIPYSRTEIFRNAFSVAAPREMNGLPAELRSSSSFREACIASFLVGD